MGLVPALTPFVPGTKIMASAVDAKFDAIVAVVNGGIEDVNLGTVTIGAISGLQDALDSKRDDVPVTWGEVTNKPNTFPATLGETSSTAYRGDRGKVAYDHTSRTDNPHEVTAAQVGARPDDWTPTWSQVGSKPSTATRWPTWGEVTSKPATATRWPTWGEVTGNFADVVSGNRVENIPIGGLVFAKTTNGVTVDYGVVFTTNSSRGLLTTNSDNTDGDYVPTGQTYKCLGRAVGASATLWIRIA